MKKLLFVSLSAMSLLLGLAYLALFAFEAVAFYVHRSHMTGLRPGLILPYGRLALVEITFAVLPLLWWTNWQNRRAAEVEFRAQKAGRVRDASDIRNFP